MSYSVDSRGIPKVSSLGGASMDIVQKEIEGERRKKKEKEGKRREEWYSYRSQMHSIKSQNVRPNSLCSILASCSTPHFSLIKGLE